MGKTTEKGKYFYGISGNTCIIKASGTLTFHISAAFDAFITRIFSDNTIENIFVDLRSAEYIDSTNLGLLARIQSVFLKKSGNTPSIISNNETVNSILQSHGFDRLFKISDFPGYPDCATQEIPDTMTKNMTTENTLLSAHKYLANSNPENSRAFSNIVRLMENDKTAQSDSGPDTV
jgi:anti-anti-sigma factor